MATIAENLLALQQTKQAFKEDLESKEIDLTGVPFTEYPNKYKEVKTTEDLDTELTEQEELLNSLEEDVNALSDKPTDRLQLKCDNTKSLYYEFYRYLGDNETLNQILNGLDTSKVTSMESMFNQANSGMDIISIPLLDTSNVTNMNKMFHNCTKLSSIPLFNTSKVTNMGYMLYSCRALTTIPQLDTSKVTNMEYFIGYCTGLTEIPQLDISSATTINSMFTNCTAITTIPKLNTQNAKAMSNMFGYCSLLTTVEGLDLRSATNTGNIFINCPNLTNLTLKNISGKTNLQIGSGITYGTLLTNESLINTFKELWDLTGSTSRTLTLSTTSKDNIANIYVKLIDVTEEMRAEDEYIDNKKPCVVCESTDAGAMTLTEYAISKNWAIA